MFKQSSCFNTIQPHEKGFIKNSTDLNKLVSRISPTRLSELIQKFEAKSGNNIYKSCLNAYGKTYCDILDLITAFAHNKTEYFARKIHFLLTNVSRISLIDKSLIVDFLKIISEIYLFIRTSQVIIWWDYFWQRRLVAILKKSKVFIKSSSKHHWRIV